MSEVVDELIELTNELKLRLWADEYYERGYPIVRLLGDLGIELYKKLSGGEE